MRTGYLTSIAALRFVAAGVVVAHHLSAVALLPPLPPILGNLGVTFFFVLSGFILARNYQGRLSGRTELVDFWRARFARVWPLHAVTLVAAIISLKTAGAPVLLDRLLLNAALLHAWVPDELVYFSFNGPAWSISVEATFYLLFPVILVALTRARSRRSVLGIAAAVWLVAVLVLVVRLHVAGSAIALNTWAFYISPGWRLVDFVTGAALGIAFASRSSGQERAEQRGSWWSDVVALGAPVLLVTAITHWVPRDQMGLNLAIGPVMAFTILICATRPGPVLRQLGRPLGVYLGEISYGVYLWHALVIAYLMRSTSLTVHPTTTRRVRGSPDVAVALRRKARPLERRRRRPRRPRPVTGPWADRSPAQLMIVNSCVARVSTA